MTADRLLNQTLAKLVQDDLGLDIIRVLGPRHRDKIALIMIAVLESVNFTGYEKK